MVKRVEMRPGPRHKRRPLGRGRSSGVEHNLAKVRVARSIRVARSKDFKDLARNLGLPANGF